MQYQCSGYIWLTKITVLLELNTEVKEMKNLFLRDNAYLEPTDNQINYNSLTLFRSENQTKAL